MNDSKPTRSASDTGLKNQTQNPGDNPPMFYLVHEGDQACKTFRPIWWELLCYHSDYLVSNFIAEVFHLIKDGYVIVADGIHLL
jgi:hypothetical protein